MRNVVLLLGFIGVLAFCSCKDSKNKTGGEYNIDNPANADNPDASKDGLSEISFEETEFNFGTVIQGEKVIHSFVFTNTGKGNLIVSNVKASCGCTVPKWTKEPIRPGQKGNVEIKFDSAGRDGKQTKTAKVYSNTVPNVTELIIRCEIIY